MRAGGGNIRVGWGGRRGRKVKRVSGAFDVGIFLREWYRYSLVFGEIDDKK